MTSDLRTYMTGHQELHAALNRSQELLQANLVELTRIQAEHTRDMAHIQATIAAHEKATADRVLLTRTEYQSLREELKTHLAEERHALRDRTMMAGAGGGLVALIGALAKLLGAW